MDGRFARYFCTSKASTFVLVKQVLLYCKASTFVLVKQVRREVLLY
jgi:hypothetical protein